MRQQGDKGAHERALGRRETFVLSGQRYDTVPEAKEQPSIPAVFCGGSDVCYNDCVCLQ